MNTTNGTHGHLSQAHAAAEMASQYAQTILPDRAEWTGNVHVDSIGDILGDDGVMLGTPKGSDNLSDAELDSHMKNTGRTGGDFAMVDVAELPTSKELIGRGKVGVYHVANVPVIG